MDLKKLLKYETLIIQMAKDIKEIKESLKGLSDIPKR